jgi:thiol:disulfide interchange protein DsbC
VAKDAVALRALTQRLPRTAVTKVDCAQVPGICEVQAGANLFYIDPSARYLIVGRIYDMETHQDLTAARLLAINPDMLVGAAAKAPEADSAGRAPSHPQSASGAAASTPAQKVSLASLPANGAIEWGGAANSPRSPSSAISTAAIAGRCTRPSRLWVRASPSGRSRSSARGRFRKA